MMNYTVMGAIGLLVFFGQLCTNPELILLAQFLGAMFPIAMLIIGFAFWVVNLD